MKTLIAYCLFFFAACNADAQYFLRGSVRDEKNYAIRSAKIYLHSSKAFYSSGSDGSFGIITSALYDSVTVSIEGFEQQTLRVKSDVWQSITLKAATAVIFKNRPKLISFTKDAKNSHRYNPFISDETYFKLVENEFVKAPEYPHTSFSLNINKASYSNVRRFINMSSKVPPDAVRTEEMLNYFNLGYEQPSGTDVFRIRSSLTVCPWNKKEQLLYLNISAKKLNIEKKVPGNFVFLIDVSGSMDMPNRLPLLKEAFQLFVKNLRPIDKVSIVTYGGTVGVWLQPTYGNEQEKINRSIEVLNAAGDTPGESAITAAYKLAKANFIPGGNNRIILATDGDFNVGQTSEKALDELITKERKTGIYLTCLGVGMGNLKDSKLQTLANRGNGNYAYIDNLQEAEKVLVQELTETLYAVADDAFVNMEFNPARVKAYRLIGFDNKRDAVQDQDSFLDGGEIGSGSSILAIFEIVPADTLTGIQDVNMKDNIGLLHLRFKEPGDTLSEPRQISAWLPGRLAIADSSGKSEMFAAAVAMYAMKLKQSPYMKASWNDILETAEKSADKSAYLQNEFIQVLQKTMEVYNAGRKKKRRKVDND